MKLYSIRSGSKGNAILVYTKNTKLLVDCGISGKIAEEGMKKASLNPEDLDAILVTHEHNDHIKGVGIMSRRYNLPVYANPKTWAAMERNLGKIDPKNKLFFENNAELKIGDICVTPFNISHDAADPVGFCMVGNAKKISIATDIGILEENLFEAIKGSHAVLLESNHDRNMLDIGGYPFQLKQRIRGNKGHLSNDDAGYAAKFLYKLGTRRIMLGHLSPENNYPLLAKQTVENILRESGIIPDVDLSLSIASSETESAIISV